MTQRHICVEQVDENIDGLDAEFEIKEDGSVEICFRDSGGVDGSIFWHFRFCPFCGKEFEE